ncbi:hypothetical protein [Parasphingorhabdus sp.]|uniref:hypothetical protein n=1 Tax=Parasphingorhabdus sp. TaxID=2709688 RepID=UPI0030017867
MKLFTVPIAMTNEARKLITVTPDREPDGIYQFGELVGRAVGIERMTGAYWFEKIIDVGGFDPEREFEYGNVVLYNNATVNKPVLIDETYYRVLGGLVRER